MLYFDNLSDVTNDCELGLSDNENGCDISCKQKPLHVLAISSVSESDTKGITGCYRQILQ